eukprot:jgi/Bigna1/53694/estExt_Genewise1Plus.C_230039
MDSSWDLIRLIWASFLTILVAVGQLAFHYHLALLVFVLLSSLALAQFGTRNVVKWPLVVIIMSLIFAELGAYVLIRLLVHGFEAFFYTSKAQNLRKQMQKSTIYEDWLKVAHRLDRLKGLDKWLRDSSSDSRYNWSLIQSLAQQMRFHRTKGEPEKILQVFSQCTRKNLGGIWKEKLYSVSHTGRTKDAVHAFVEEVEKSMQWLGDHSPKLSSEMLGHTIKFMTRVQKSYGKTGLFLSGGASNGNYHWGIIDALLKQDCFPEYLSGTSAGAVVVSLLGTRTDEELKSILNTGELVQRLTCFDEDAFTCLSRLYKSGSLFSRKQWVEKIKWFTQGDTTFQEAFERTGRVININVSEAGEHGQPVMLNHDTTPNVVIFSAVIASAAMSIFVKPQQLLVKRADGKVVPRHAKSVEQFVDGCFQRDVPIREMSELYNIRFSIVSQVNPHMVPFHFRGQGEAGAPSRWRRRTGGWRGGFLLSAFEMMLKIDMKKNLLILDRLGLVNEDNIGATSLFLQNFDGDITLVPPIRAMDYFKLISDPGADLKRYCQVGSRITWKKLPMLKLRLAIERAVERCIESLKKEAKCRQLKTEDSKSLDETI